MLQARAVSADILRCIMQPALRSTAEQCVFGKSWRAIRERTVIGHQPVVLCCHGVCFHRCQHVDKSVQTLHVYTGFSGISL